MAKSICKYCKYSYDSVVYIEEINKSVELLCEKFSTEKTDYISGEKSMTTCSQYNKDGNCKEFIERAEPNIIFLELINCLLFFVFIFIISYAFYYKN